MQLTGQLQQLQAGNRDAMNAVIPLVYHELKKLARSHLRREARTLPLHTTALVHEAFLKLAQSRQPVYENRTHFYGIASRLMRQVLVETARARATEKRGGAREVSLMDMTDRDRGPDRSVLALDEALRALERTDPRKAQLIEMRYFGGMTAEECAISLSMSVHVVRRELRLAQAWLRRELAQSNAANARHGSNISDDFGLVHDVSSGAKGRPEGPAHRGPAPPCSMR
jgi:RNA polymerase sigma factor (TIGR02999 family)